MSESQTRASRKLVAGDSFFSPGDPSRVVAEGSLPGHQVCSKAKHHVYTGLVLNTLLYGSESWCLPEYLVGRLHRFHMDQAMRWHKTARSGARSCAISHHRLRRQTTTPSPKPQPTSLPADRSQPHHPSSHSEQESPSRALKRGHKPPEPAEQHTRIKNF